MFGVNAEFRHDALEGHTQTTGIDTPNLSAW